MTASAIDASGHELMPERQEGPPRQSYGRQQAPARAGLGIAVAMWATLSLLGWAVVAGFVSLIP